MTQPLDREDEQVERDADDGGDQDGRPGDVEPQATGARRTITRPRTWLDPPKYSATIAPMRLSVVATFRPVKKKGSAFGRRSLRRTSPSLAALARSSSYGGRRHLGQPADHVDDDRKNTSRMTTAIFASGFRMPNQLLMIGATAMIGTAGDSRSPAGRRSRGRVPSARRRTPRRHRGRRRWPVRRPLRQGCSWRRAGASPTPTRTPRRWRRGEAGWNCRRPRAAASTSQMTTTVTNTRIAGRYSRTRRPIRVAGDGEAGSVAGRVVTSIGSAITRPSRRIGRGG